MVRAKDKPISEIRSNQDILKGIEADIDLHSELIAQTQEQIKKARVDEKVKLLRVLTLLSKTRSLLNSNYFKLKNGVDDLDEAQDDNDELAQLIKTMLSKKRS